MAAVYSNKDDLALVVRDGSALPDIPELHLEADRHIEMYFTKQGISEQQKALVQASDDAMAHLRYAAACKVMALHYQGMGDPTMLERAAFWHQQFQLTMADVPVAAAEDALYTVPPFSGGDLGYA